MDNNRLEELITETLNEMYPQGKKPSINDEWKKFLQNNENITRGVNKPGIKPTKAILAIAALIVVGFLCTFFVSQNIYKELGSNKAFLGGLFHNDNDIVEIQENSLSYVPDGFIIDSDETIVNDNGTNSIKYINESNDMQITFSCVDKNQKNSYSSIIQGELIEEYKSNNIDFDIFESEDRGKRIYEAQWSNNEFFYHIITDISYDQLINILENQSK